MNITTLTEQQRKDLLDLLVLTTYVDGKLDAVADQRLQRLLTDMGFESEYDQQRQFDVSVTRARQHLHTPEAARAQAVRLAQSFTTPGQQQAVYQLMDELVWSDNEVVTEENQFLSAVKEAFHM